MKEPRWVLDEIAQAAHSLLLAEHGGGTGVRDTALLESALSRPKQKFNYQPDSTIFELAAAYSFSIAKITRLSMVIKDPPLQLGSYFWN